MADSFEPLERLQIANLRGLAARLDKGGPRARAYAAQLRALADRQEQRIKDRQPEGTRSP
jgi:hypothetical protein